MDVYFAVPKVGQIIQEDKWQENLLQGDQEKGNLAYGGFHSMILPKEKEGCRNLEISSRRRRLNLAC